MADGNELLIKISADAKNVKKAFDDVRDQTEDLEKTLGTIAKVSAVGFAALTAEVGFSLKAFAEAEAASRTLSQALQAQGIYTKELADDYKGYASAVQEATGVDDDAVVSAQAVAQGYLGQTKITKELTFAIADLAQAKGIDLNSAAALVAKTIGTNTNALAREGLEIDATASKSERFAKTLEFLQGRYAGQAAAANEGLGSLRGLQSAFGDLQEAIGERFAPAAEAAIAGLTGLFNTISGSEEVTNLVVALISAGLAVTALGVAIPAVVTGLGVMKAAMAAAGIATTTTKLAVNALIGATGIGLLVVAITELALHWDKVWPRVTQVAKGAVEALSGAFGGLGKILSGAFTLDIDQIKEGLEQVKQAFSKGAEVAFADLPKQAEDATKKQNEVLKSAADKRAADEAVEEQRKIALAKASQDVQILQLKNASQAAVDIKKAEVETLKAILASQNETEKALLQEKYERLRASEDEQRALDLERNREYAQLLKEARDETSTQELEDLTIFQEQKRAQIAASQLTEQEAEQKVLNDALQRRIDSNNKRLIEQKRFGEAYAAINQLVQSQEVQGAKSAAGELVALTQSKNANLKAIGKAAAIANIVVKTAESAMNIYAGFSTIPFIGPALGVAGAAAAIAFGAEQVGNVTAAASGALVTGGTPGRDSVPYLLEPGELVAPKKNFEEVVQGVQYMRGMQPAGEGGGASARIELSFTDDVMDFIEAKLVERRNLSLSIQGVS